MSQIRLFHFLACLAAYSNAQARTEEACEAINGLYVSNDLDNYCLHFSGPAESIDDASKCAAGCSNWGECLPAEMKDFCADSMPVSLHLIIALLGVMAAVVLFYLLYCMCCRGKHHEDYQKP